LTWKVSTGIHVKMFLSTVRLLEARPNKLAQTTTVAMNEPPAMMVAIQPESGSPVRRPPNSSTRVPMSGRATMT
jgi:hypothetical protein